MLALLFITFHAKPAISWQEMSMKKKSEGRVEHLLRVANSQAARETVDEMQIRYADQWNGEIWDLILLLHSPKLTYSNFSINAFKIYLAEGWFILEIISR